MTRIHEPLRGRPLTMAIAVALLGGSLAGCITIFPKEKPAQLYRFAYEPSGATAAPAAAPFTVRAMVSSFDRSASTDRILTTRGETVAYLADARWAQSASSLLENAVQTAFAGRGPAAVLARGELGSPDYRLTLSVPVFEARYLEGSSEPPTVVVEITAALDAISRPAPRRDRIFRSEVKAQSNSVHAIVTAFDTAVTDVLNQLVGWTDAKGAS